jgi:hypothetical protein
MVVLAVVGNNSHTSCLVEDSQFLQIELRIDYIPFFMFYTPDTWVMDTAEALTGHLI